MRTYSAKHWYNGNLILGRLPHCTSYVIATSCFRSIHIAFWGWPFWFMTCVSAARAWTTGMYESVWSYNKQLTCWELLCTRRASWKRKAWPKVLPLVLPSLHETWPRWQSDAWSGGCLIWALVGAVVGLALGIWHCGILQHRQPESITMNSQGWSQPHLLLQSSSSMYGQQQAASRSYKGYSRLKFEV